MVSLTLRCNEISFVSKKDISRNTEIDCGTGLDVERTQLSSDVGYDLASSRSSRTMSLAQTLSAHLVEICVPGIIFLRACFNASTEQTDKLIFIYLLS